MHYVIEFSDTVDRIRKDAWKLLGSFLYRAMLTSISQIGFNDRKIQ
jgi:hypothetical protein